MASPASSMIDMGGWPVDRKCVGSGGVLLMSDSSDSDDRSWTSEGTRSADGTSEDVTRVLLAVEVVKARGWSVGCPCPYPCPDLRFLGEEGVLVVLVKVVVVVDSLERV
jgi:hypothetical protein